MTTAWYADIVPSVTPYFADDAVCIIHADCFDIMPKIQQGKVDVVLTDPDYNAADIGPNNRTYENGMPKLSDSEYRAFCALWFGQAQVISKRIVFTSGVANIWNYPKARWVLSWHKPGAVSFSKLGGFAEWEPVLIYDDGYPPITHDTYSATPNNFTVGPEKEHPCPKHPGFWQWVLDSVSRPNEVVLDIFAGSGTTGRVAKNLGRKAILIERVERYCEISAKRMSQGVLL